MAGAETSDSPCRRQWRTRRDGRRQRCRAPRSAAAGAGRREARTTERPGSMAAGHRFHRKREGVGGGRRGQGARGAGKPCAGRALGRSRCSAPRRSPSSSLPSRQTGIPEHGRLDPRWRRVQAWRAGEGMGLVMRRRSREDGQAAFEVVEPAERCRRSSSHGLALFSLDTRRVLLARHRTRQLAQDQVLLPYSMSACGRRVSRGGVW